MANRKVEVIRRGEHGQILATAKYRPAWANESDLKRVILTPAIRQLRVWQMFYQENKTTREISQATGLSGWGIKMLLVRARRGLGVTRPDRPCTDLTRGRRRFVPAKHDQFATGFEMEAKRWGVRGGHYGIPVVSEDQLREYFLQPSLQRYQLAKMYWLDDLTARQIACRLGIKQASVEFQLMRIARVMNNPMSAIHVSRGVTKAGKQRVGVTAPYERKGKGQCPAQSV